jgi:hypothetical protein
MPRTLLQEGRRFYFLNLSVSALIFSTAPATLAFFAPEGLVEGLGCGDDKGRIASPVPQRK